jgi:hypothetical protein
VATCAGVQLLASVRSGSAPDFSNVWTILIYITTNN